MSTGQAIGGVVGAAAGFVIGGPTGAMYGAQIGMMAGGYLDPPKGPTMEGPRLSDLAVQTSTYGAFIPRTYGTVGINGNVFWLEGNKLKEVVKKKKSGGKGGGSSATTKTYSYFATLAVGLCEGPVDGIRRIWAGPTLIYDAGSGDIDSIIASNAAKQKNFSFYYGDDTQLPDSRMQADLGFANTPAYRGLCYVVIKDFALAKYGNAIPAFKFEVVKKAAIPSTIFSESDISIGTPYNSNAASGVAYDARGYRCAVIKDAAADSVRLVSIRQDGTFLTRYISRYQASTVGPVHPIACAMNSNVAAWFGSYYPGFSATLNWITNSGTERMFTFPYIPAGAAVSFADMVGSDFVYFVFGTVSSRTLIKVVDGSVVLASVALPTNNTGMLTTFDNNVALATPRSGGIDVLIYSEDLALVDSYSITLGGIVLQFAGEHSGCPTISGKTYAVSLSDPNGLSSLNQIVEIDFYNRSARLFNVSEPANWVNPSRGSTSNIGGVVAFNWINTASGLVSTILWKLEDQIEVVTTLQEIISAECALTGLLTAGDIDVTTLTDTATGYRVAKIGSVRNAIEPLQAVWPFDAVQTGYKIKFRRRGLASVAAVTAGDLGVDEQLRQVREMDSQLPNNIVCNYLDRGRNYDANQQVWGRPSTGAVNTRTMDIPAVLTATQAAQVIERLGYLYWLERVDFGPFSLPPSFAHLEPADVVTLTTEYATYELRLTSVNYKSDGSLECMARLNQASTYTSLVVADDVDDDATVGRDGPSNYLLLDIPVVDEALQNTPGMVGVMCGYTGSWSGGTIWRSPDAGQSWSDIQSFNAACTFGYARVALPAHAGKLIDYGRSLTVDLLAGELSGVTESQMLNGANIAAYGAHGRWEIMRFTNATLNADGSYTISGLWRGDKGTEWATGLHQANDSFVLLDDPDGAFIGLATELIGAPRYYRGITNGDDIESDSSLSLTYNAVNLECLSPANAKGARSAGDLLITWQRRTRVGGEWRDSVEVSLGETSEAYEIDVMSGATVKRTITATSQTATYTSAQQVTDFGSAQASITVRIYQLSSVVGRGYPLEVTL